MHDADARGGGGAALVMAPSSVLENWARELRAWSALSVVELKGGLSADERRSALERARDGRVEVVLTTHDMLNGLREEAGAVAWRVVVIDELHEFKNAKSRRHETAAGLRLHTRGARFGLTGTPFPVLSGPSGMKLRPLSLPLRHAVPERV